MPNFFFYGTLMHPDVRTRVVRGSYRCEPAALTGFARYRVRGQTYPAMMEKAGEAVDGVVCFDVSDADVVRLDRFEGEDYLRQVVHPALSTGNVIRCEAYLYRIQRAERLEVDEWNMDWFQQHGLKEFLATYDGWAEVD